MEPTGRILALFVVFQVFTSTSCRVCDFSIDGFASQFVRKRCAFFFHEKSETRYIGFEFRLKDNEGTKQALETVKVNFREFLYSPLTRWNDSCDCNKVPCLNEEQSNDLFILSVEQAIAEAKWRIPFIPELCCSVHRALVEIIYRLDEKQLTSLKKCTLNEMNTRKCTAYLTSELRQTEWCHGLEAKCENITSQIFKGCQVTERRKRDIGVKNTLMCGPSACYQGKASVLSTPLPRIEGTSYLGFHDFSSTPSQSSLRLKASLKSVVAINSGSSDIFGSAKVHELASRVSNETVLQTFPVPSLSGSWISPAKVGSAAQSSSPFTLANMTSSVTTNEVVSKEKPMFTRAHKTAVPFSTRNVTQNSQSPTTAIFWSGAPARKLSTSKSHVVPLSPTHTTREETKCISEKSSPVSSAFQSTNSGEARLVGPTDLTVHVVSVSSVQNDTLKKSVSSFLKLQSSFLHSSSLPAPELPPLPSISSSSSLILHSTPLLLRSSASSALLPILETQVSSFLHLPFYSLSLSHFRMTSISLTRLSHSMTSSSTSSCCSLSSPFSPFSPSTSLSSPSPSSSSSAFLFSPSIFLSLLSSSLSSSAFLVSPSTSLPPPSSFSSSFTSPFSPSTSLCTSSSFSSSPASFSLSPASFSLSPTSFSLSPASFSSSPASFSSSPASFSSSPASSSSPTSFSSSPASFFSPFSSFPPWSPISSSAFFFSSSYCLPSSSYSSSPSLLPSLSPSSFPFSSSPSSLLSSSLSSSSSVSTKTAPPMMSSVIHSVIAPTSSSMLSSSFSSLQSHRTELSPSPAQLTVLSTTVSKITSSPPSTKLVALWSSISSPLLNLLSPSSSLLTLPDVKRSFGVTSPLPSYSKHTFVKNTFINAETFKRDSSSSSIPQSLIATPSKPSTTVPGVTDTFLMKFQGHCSFIFNKEDFKLAFVTALIKLLPISRYNVIVYDVKCGSVDVTFRLQGHNSNLTEKLWATIANESFVVTFNGTLFVAFDLRQIITPSSITFTDSRTPSSIPTGTPTRHGRKRIVFIIFVLIGSVFGALFIYCLVLYVARFCSCCQKTRGKFRVHRNVRLQAPLETELKRFTAHKNIFQGVNYYGEITQLEETRTDVELEIVEDDIDEELSELSPLSDTDIYLLNGYDHANSYQPQEHKFVFDDDGSCSSVVFY